jgi:hypothetical protein
LPQAVIFVFNFYTQNKRQRAFERQDDDKIMDEYHHRNYFIRDKGNGARERESSSKCPKTVIFYIRVGKDEQL